MKKWCIVASLLIVLPALTGCALTGGGEAVPGKLEIVDKELIKDESGSRVVVTVKNVGSNKIELAEVTVKFYDKNEGLIETGKDAVMNLKPAESWTFTIECKGEGCGEVQSCRVEALAGTSSGRVW